VDAARFFVHVRIIELDEEMALRDSEKGMNFINELVSFGLPSYQKIKFCGFLALLQGFLMLDTETLSSTLTTLTARGVPELKMNVHHF
jgi:hypothetical protein